MKALAIVQNRFGSMSLPKFKLPRIVMPWTRRINILERTVDDMANAIAQMDVDLNERIEEVDQGIDERFDNTEYVTRMEIDSLIEDGVASELDGSLEDAMTDKIAEAFANATFDVEVSLN